MDRSQPARLSLWVWAFCLTSALQLFRGSAGDSIIFVSGTVLILLSTTAFRNFAFPSERFVTGNGLDWVALILLVSLGFTPRHSAFDLGLFVLLLPILIAMAWGARTEPVVKLTKRDRQTRLMWSIWAVAMCLWEFGANIAGQMAPDPNMFPTISVLVDPILKSEIGQAGFVLVWLSVGYYLIKAGAKR